MKNIITLIVLFTILSCKAQIIPVEEHLDYKDSEIEFPDGAYLKDINNLFDKFVGTWIGNFDNKTYEFIINKILYKSQIRPLTIDKLELRYKILDSSGNLIEDTTNLPNDNNLVVRGRYFSNTSNFYILYYHGEEADCGQQGNLYIEVLESNQNIMKANLAVMTDHLSTSQCPNGLAEQVLPIEQFTLVKQ